MIKGGGCVGACTRQPPTAQTHTRKISVGSGGLCAVAPRPTPLLLLKLLCSAYLVFISVDACLMECSFRLCVRFSGDVKNTDCHTADIKPEETNLIILLTRFTRKGL